MSSQEGGVVVVDTIYQLDVPAHLALLGDMHGRPYQDIINSLKKHHPGLILIVGDILYGVQPPEDRSPLVAQPYVLPFLEGCSHVAKTFLSLGNHEWMLDDGDFRQIRMTGVTILDNSWEKWNGMVIGGLTSAYVRDYRRYRDGLQLSHLRYPEKVAHEGRNSGERVPDLSWLTAFCQAPGYHILLSHHPEYYPMIPKDVELILSAHAHGGAVENTGGSLGSWARLVAKMDKGNI